VFRPRFRDCNVFEWAFSRHPASRWWLSLCGVFIDIGCHASAPSLKRTPPLAPPDQHPPALIPHPTALDARTTTAGLYSEAVRMFVGRRVYVRRFFQSFFACLMLYSFLQMSPRLLWFYVVIVLVVSAPILAILELCDILVLHLFVSLRLAPCVRVWCGPRAPPPLPASPFSFFYFVFFVVRIFLFVHV